MSTAKRSKRGTAMPVEAERRQGLLEATNAAYTSLRGDPEAWQAELPERALWDATLLDGLESDERWTEGGDVVRPVGTGS
jgi:hypothetical protein